MKLGLPFARGAERASARGAQGPTAADHAASPPRPPSALVAAAELCIAMFLTTPWLWPEPPVDALLLRTRSCARHRPSEAVGHETRARRHSTKRGKEQLRCRWTCGCGSVRPPPVSERRLGWVADALTSQPQGPCCGCTRGQWRGTANGRNPRPPAKVWVFTCHPRPF